MEKITIKNDRVLLYLPNSSYKKTRQVGFIETGIFRTYRDAKKHLLRVRNALGFNHHLIKNCDAFNLICVDYNCKELWTSRKAILKNGEFFHFSNGTLELQVFLPLKYFKGSKKEAEEELKQIEDTGRNKETSGLYRNYEVSKLRPTPQLELFEGA